MINAFALLLDCVISEMAKTCNSVEFLSVVLSGFMLSLIFFHSTEIQRTMQRTFEIAEDDCMCIYSIMPPVTLIDLIELSLCSMVAFYILLSPGQIELMRTPSIQIAPFLISRRKKANGKQLVCESVRCSKSFYHFP